MFNIATTMTKSGNQNYLHFDMCYIQNVKRFINFMRYLAIGRNQG